MADDDLDRETAERLARARLIEALRHPEESSTSEVASLAESAAEIMVALERGETPAKRDIKDARRHLEEVETFLDEVTALFGWTRRGTGVKWGDLTEEERAETEARDRKCN